MRGTAAHRKDIDGLRAVAILPVLFYHANIWPFAGGYVGVDVFFVLSGYLITGLILREHETTAFSLVAFYDRRVRRILPALFLVLAAATIAALFILMPDELRLYGRGLLASIMFGANIDFWLRDNAYFAPQSGENPLLHIWSLAVEEQFYLFWPLLLVFLTRFRRALPWIVAALLIASLALTLVLARIDPNATFYLLPTRAWQLLAGAVLSCAAFSGPRSAVACNGIALSGLALVLVAIVLPGDAALYHPVNAVAATLGTALILFANDSGPNLVSAALATRAPVFIGLVSYSLYLWHWPALVFARLYLNRAPAPGEAIIVLLAAFGASVLSWYFVEQPLRRRAGTWHGVRVSFPVAGTVAAVLAIMAGVFYISAGLPQRLTTDVRAVAAEAGHNIAGTWCTINDNTPNCRQGRFPDVAVLWGDSHARALASGLVGFAAARRMSLRQYTSAACPPLPDLTVVAPNGTSFGRCQRFRREVLSLILQERPRLVILEARWEVFFNEHRIRSTGTPDKAFADALARVLDALGSHGIPVLVIGNIPRFADHPAHCYGRDRLAGRDPAHCMGESWSAGVDPLVQSERLVFQAVVPRTAFVRYHPAFTDLCDRAGCHAFSAGHLLYVDEHHLTPFGAALVGAKLDAALRNWPR